MRKHKPRAFIQNRIRTGQSDVTHTDNRCVEVDFSAGTTCTNHHRPSRPRPLTHPPRPNQKPHHINMNPQPHIFPKKPQPHLPFYNQQRTISQRRLKNNAVGPYQEVHLVNSSLIFFFDRTDSENLQLLANAPTLAPRALEILLRNWKPGGDHFSYALKFPRAERMLRLDRRHQLDPVDRQR